MRGFRDDIQHARTKLLQKQTKLQITLAKPPKGVHKLTVTKPRAAADAQEKQEKEQLKMVKGLNPKKAELKKAETAATQAGAAASSSSSSSADNQANKKRTSAEDSNGRRLSLASEKGVDTLAL